MGDKNEDKIKVLLSDVDKEFQRLNPYVKAKFAIEQISVWQQKYHEAKNKIHKESFVDATSERTVIGQDAELDA
jgi:predicted transposase YbfD/YdcC